MKIVIRIKRNYGQDRFYPVCHVAAKFTELTKTDTLTLDALTVIKKLGYEIEVEQTTLDGYGI